MAISLGVGIVWVILVQCLPKVMTIGVMVLSIFVLLMWGFLLIFDK